MVSGYIVITSVACCCIGLLHDPPPASSNCSIAPERAKEKGYGEAVDGLYKNFLSVWDTGGTSKGCREAPSLIFISSCLLFFVLAGFALVFDGPMVQDLCNRSKRKVSYVAFKGHSFLKFA